MCHSASLPSCRMRPADTACLTGLMYSLAADRAEATGRKRFRRSCSGQAAQAPLRPPWRAGAGPGGRARAPTQVSAASGSPSNASHCTQNQRLGKPPPQFFSEYAGASAKSYRRPPHSIQPLARPCAISICAPPARPGAELAGRGAAAPHRTAGAAEWHPPPGRRAPRACQWGSNTGSAASQPAVARCRSPAAPQPLTGRTENAQRALPTVEGRSPAAPASHATSAPAHARRCRLAAARAAAEHVALSTPMLPLPARLRCTRHCTPGLWQAQAYRSGSECRRKRLGSCPHGCNLLLMGVKGRACVDARGAGTRNAARCPVRALVPGQRGLVTLRHRRVKVRLHRQSPRCACHTPQRFGVSETPHAPRSERLKGLRG